VSNNTLVGMMSNVISHCVQRQAGEYNSQSRYVSGGTGAVQGLLPRINQLQFGLSLTESSFTVSFEFELAIIMATILSKM